MCLCSGTTEPLPAACDAGTGWEHRDQLLLQTHIRVSALLLPIENHRYETGGLTQRFSAPFPCPRSGDKTAQPRYYLETKWVFRQLRTGCNYIV